MQRRIEGLSMVASWLLFGVAACSSGTQLVGTQFVKSAVVGPSGGVVAVAADDQSDSIVGTSITVPAGALTQAQTIQIGVSNQAVVGSGALGPVVDFEPSGLTFSKPATVQIPVTLGAGVGAAAVRVEAVEADGSSRVIVPTSVSGGLATFEVSGFTHFGAFLAIVDAGVGCSADADCATGQVCVNGACEAAVIDAGTCVPACNDLSQCRVADGCGGVCTSTCVDAGQSTGCSTDADCATGQVCVNGACEAAVIDAGTCVPACNDLSQCGAADGCGGVCTSTCVDAGQSTGCSTDADCAAGQVCVNGACEAAVIDGGACVPACNDLSQCGVTDGCGGVCTSTCVDAGKSTGCSTDADCATGQVCVNGACEAAVIDAGTCVPACNDLSQCGVTDGCGGVCTSTCADAGQGLACGSAADCATGLSCVNGVCQ